MEYLLGADFAPHMVVYILSFIALLTGSITDLRTREVPDWVNYGLIFSGVLVNALLTFILPNQILVREAAYNNLVYSQYIISGQSYMIGSILGLAVFFGIAYIMFYAGQWGGGDSKILMGLGAMIGIGTGGIGRQFLTGFFINSLFVGAAYGLLWSFFLVFKNKKKFIADFKRLLSANNVVKAKKFMIAALVLLLIPLFFIDIAYARIIALSFAFLILASFYLWIFIRSVEKSCMQKLVEPSKLTEGDWIVNDVYIGRHYICGPKDLGISKSQIRKLIQLYRKGKAKKILIKEGVPFVPSFFIAFVVTLVVGNPMMWLL